MLTFKAAPGAQRVVHVTQGSFAVSRAPETMFTTVLGSCVAACLRDPVAGIGGMNHFLLPGECRAGSQSYMSGVHAMELLINDLLKQGARKDRMEAKLFGGGRIIEGLTDVGQRNAEFARDFLEREGIARTGESLGGIQARRVRYWPESGKAQQLLIGQARDVPARPVPQPPAGVDLAGSDVEFL